MFRIVDITRTFEGPSGEVLPVLRGVSLSVSPNEIIALMGPNGCGKTTLLNIIAGDLRADSGMIYLNGQCLLSLSAHRRACYIGRVHQDSYKAIASDLTVADVLSIASRRGKSLSLRMPNCSKAIQTVRGMCIAVGEFLCEHAQIKTNALSGGQRQLLALAVAVLGDPPVLLLDEHKASLDEKYGQVADELLTAYIHNSNSFALVVTHDRKWASALCSSIGHFSDGIITLVQLRPAQNGG